MLSTCNWSLQVMNIISFFGKFLLVTCFGFAVLVAPVATQPTIPAPSTTTHWNYENPNEWKEQFSSCGGAHQSPINLALSQAIAADYPEFVFTNYDQVFNEMVSNNGHTVTLQLLETSPSADDFPHITYGGLNDRYNFYQLHLHWGRGTLRGSEHHIHGQPYPAELHMVHYNTKYGSFNQAVPFPDGLAVLGVMIELQTKDNTAFRHIERFDSITKADENKSSFLRSPIPLSDLLPDSTRSFYRYNGSLTTPGCNEDVIWTVFDTPIAISERQLIMLRRLKDDKGRPLEDNFRPVQAVHDRVLLYRPDHTVYPWRNLESAQDALLAKKEHLRQQFALSLAGK